jgi:flagellin
MDQRERVFIGTMTAQGLGIQGTNGLPSTATFISISSPDKANIAIGLIDSALKIVNKQRADLGAYQNRLENTMRGLAVGAENLQAAESRIRDEDMAAGMVAFVRDQILVQSATAMLAQANTKPQSVLQLFR